MNPAQPEFDPIHGLYAYTLTHPDPAFLHQHAVDAHTAQTATAFTKAIALAFALFGLYAAVEKGLTGKQVQRFHMHMARSRRAWPTFDLAPHPAAITANDVLATPPGPERDGMIHTWAAAVWNSYRHTRTVVVEFARSAAGLQP